MEANVTVLRWVSPHFPPASRIVSASESHSEDGDFVVVAVGNNIKRAINSK